MIIDIHTHVGEKKDKAEILVSATLEQLHHEMKKNKVDYAVSFVLGKDVEKGSIRLAGKCGGNILPFFRFDPKKTQVEELRKALPSFRGVKLHPRMENFDPLDSEYTGLFKVIEESGKPVLIHTRKENNPFSDPDRLLALVERYPGIDFIFGHFANGVNSVISAAKELPNLFLETSIVSSPKIIELAVRKCGSEKILFGSDFPYSDQELELEKVLRADINEEDRKNILGRNAVMLLKS